MFHLSLILVASPAISRWKCGWDFQAQANLCTTWVSLILCRGVGNVWPHLSHTSTSWGWFVRGQIFFFSQSTSAFTCLGQVNLTHPLGLEHTKFDWTLLCTSVKLEKLQQTSVEQHGSQTCGCGAAGYSGNALPPLDVSAPSKNASPMVSQS